MIRATVNAQGLIEVEYTRTHVGHKLESKHLKIPNDIREYVIQRLKQLTPTSEILAQCQAMFPRAELLTRKAVTNIAASSGLKLVKAFVSMDSVETKKTKAKRIKPNKS